MKKTIKTLISEIGTIPDYFSDKFRKKYNLILIDEAHRQIHFFPNSSNALNNAINRLKFGEHFFFSINDVIKKITFEQASIKGTLIKTGVQTKLIYNAIDFELTKLKNAY